MRLSTDDEFADVRNNVLYVTAAGNRLAMLADSGAIDLGHNWIKPGWVVTHGGNSPVVFDDGTNIAGTVPGFADPGSDGFRPTPGSEIADAGGTLHPDVLPTYAVTRQYVEHQQSEARPDDGFPDLGAFEFCAVPCPEPASAMGTLLALSALGGISRPRKVAL